MDEEAFIKQIGNCKAISTYFKRIPDDEIRSSFRRVSISCFPIRMWHRVGLT